MPNIGFWEIAAIGLLIILLFGWKKLPDTARALGRSMRIFKAETSALRDDDTERSASPAPAAQAQPQPSQPAQASPQPIAAPAEQPHADGSGVNGQPVASQWQQQDKR
ncbi:Sec-independent protein translocase subunit TatA [Allonocardiopsis opalescens]|uniref:Sec-independent protein translocase protein TatA n=1 Tax=Allonocardiopsis opalescens TaxID=1144618 RepID=A0A2T0PTW5_9ACTN|nr:Sec-independent protein translocase subunit TatA [Allonocardiopsis opalescens]PRX92340.1 sec-independent protein translocase protein TatA [Allonocardiopsis opalescens]